MSLDDDFFCVCCFVVKEKKKSLFNYSILAVLSFLFEEEVKEDFFTLFKKENASSSDTSFLFSS